MKADDTAELRPVRLGQRQGDEVVVTDGLAPNERVVLAGQMLVRPGGKVHIDSNSAAGQKPGTDSQVNPASGGQS